MSRFFSSKYDGLIPYVPGEQPRDAKYIKLNTNESPFAPDKSVIEASAEAAKSLQLYSDPTCCKLTKAVADRLGVDVGQVLMTNGSDEILNFMFMAFCDATHPIVFPDITYGFYSVFAKLNGIPYETIPLNSDFSVDVEAFIGIGKNIVIANPNAPTGIALAVSEIERIVSSNPDNIVIIDEAYVDFGAESCVSLLDRYDNLLITQTFSKSRSLAGARLGFGIGSAELIAELNTIKFSTNPYNINRMTMAAGLAEIENDEINRRNCKIICDNRIFAYEQLKRLGFTMTESYANFLFVKSDRIGGEQLYKKLKAKGILVRHFDAERIEDYNRITIGTREQMEAFISAVQTIFTEENL